MGAAWASTGSGSGGSETSRKLLGKVMRQVASATQFCLFNRCHGRFPGMDAPKFAQHRRVARHCVGLIPSRGLGCRRREAQPRSWTHGGPERTFLSIPGKNSPCGRVSMKKTKNVIPDLWSEFKQSLQDMIHFPWRTDATSYGSWHLFALGDPSAVTLDTPPAGTLWPSRH